MFYVGQKVVCTSTWPRKSWRDTWNFFWHPYESPKKDEVFTISNVYLTDDGVLMLELAEFPSPETDQWMAGFYAVGFRPLVERKTDIGFAHEILRKVGRNMPVKVRA